MNGHLLHSPFDFAGEFAHRLPLLTPIEPDFRRDWGSHVYPNRASEPFLALVIDSQRHDLQINGPLGDGLARNARRTGAHLLNGRSIVTFTLRENTDRFPSRQA